VSAQRDLTLAARSELPVLISARSGRVRSEYARAIHETSERGGDPLITIRCDGGNGHAREATDQMREQLAAACHGSVFLDRVDTLTPSGQGELFSLIERLSRRRAPRGGDRLPAVRLISGSRHSLLRLVAAGRFREDLFYRLNAIHLIDPGQ